MESLMSHVAGQSIFYALDLFFIAMGEEWHERRQTNQRRAFFYIFSAIQNYLAKSEVFVIKKVELERIV